MTDPRLKKALRVIIAGGGTGGHLYPGLALAEELKGRNEETEILFVGTSSGLEAKVLPREGYRLKTIKVDKLVGMKGIQKIKTLLLIPVAFIQSMWIILRFKPQVAVGVGGYAAGPVVIIAALMGVSTVIHEQNVYPGFTNRVLGRFVDVIAISFSQTASAFPADKTRVTGNPLRKRFSSSPQAPGKTPHSGADTLLILGGSRGARSINRAVMEALPLLSSWKEPLRIIHQTGEEDYQEVSAAYASSGLEAEVESFFQDIDRCYLEADLVLARAGATTLAELMACGKASILVPYPFAAGSHQEANAMELKRAGAAEVVPDAELSGQLLAGTIKKLIEDSEMLEEMSTRLAGYGRPEAAVEVADLIYDLVYNNSTSTKEKRLNRSNPDAHLL